MAFDLGVMREVGKHSPRSYQHPPHDPEYRNVITRSTDRGETWDAPRVFPGFEWTGVENPGLTLLRNGDLLASVYQRKFYPLESGLKMKNLLGLVRKDPYPWIVAHGGTFVHRSRDNGRTWGETVEVSTKPYVSGYSPRGPVELANGNLLLPLAAADPFYLDYFTEHKQKGPAMGNDFGSDGQIKPGRSAAFVSISRDGGRTWNETREIARDPNVDFYETALVRLASGRLIAHMRTEENGDHYLYQVTSDDDGGTWSKPWKTPVLAVGSPADLVQLADGRVLTIYGRRRQPFGIRACLSRDEGRTWDTDREIVLRDDLHSTNLGYPTAIVLKDGSVFAVYWGEDPEFVTTVQGTYFKP
ncbi:MAG: sialidase family protein [Bryobacteraceae bacterium]